MLTHLKRLSAQTVIYGLGDVVTSALNLVLLPLYTRLLPPEDYGRLALILVVSAVVSILLESGQRSAYLRFYFHNEDPSTRSRLTGTVFIYLLLLAGAMVPILQLLLKHVGPALVRDRVFLSLLQVALIGAFFDVGAVIPFATFRVEQRPVPYATLTVTRFLINATLNVLVLAVFGWGVIGVIYANLFTSILFFFICLALVLRTVRWKLDLPVLRQALGFGLPLVPASLAGWALTFSDRFFLQRYANLHEVGVYAVGYSVAGILNMMMGWFNVAWGPYCFSIADQPDAKKVYARVTTYALGFFALVGLGLSLFAHEVLSLLTTPSYEAAFRVVPLIVLAYLFFEMNYLMAFGFDLSYKTAYYPLIIIAGAGINLILNLMLIPRFGMMGAALSTALSYAVLPLMVFLIARRFYPVPYEWKRLLLLGTVTVGVYGASVVLKTGTISVDLGIGIFLIFLWAGTLTLARFLTPSERKALRSLAFKDLLNVHVLSQDGGSGPHGGTP